ncbi:universal stress protein [Mastigocoleus testarum]|uniref:Universal stress protein UspA n=1 Tax=Mastigocoleus testarum BC008 TaxID=371196 RepID=A0A0V7ZMB5_9CYAN|nr:universal stress protein [Mastigocoleus testarum]KST65582.1 universal stress protein UspA [Mastigocoleus testarum BC008]KST66028.1 universal stress protein UspA [Mastigocoleus testarum BC008]
MFHNVLVAIDTSDISQYVFDEAVSLAKINDARLLLLHILNPLDEQYIDPVFVQPTILYPEYQAQRNEIHLKDWKKLKEDRLKWLHARYEEAKNLGIVTEFNQYVGEAGRTICDTALSWGADIIIMGRRGRRGLSEFFLGSVSNYVLHHACCSVLVVQGPANKTTDEEVSETEKITEKEKISNS